MRDTWVVGAFVLTVALGGCTSEPPAEDAEKAELQQRVADLEQERDDQRAAEEGLSGEARDPAGEPQATAATLAAREQVLPVARRSAGSPAAAARPLATRTASDATPVAADPPDVVAATPTPLPVPVRVAAGAKLELVLETPLSSRDSQLDDRVVARVQRATDAYGADLLPGGSSVEGRVTEVERSGKVKGRARLSVGFDTILVRGRRYGLSATGLTLEAEGSQKRDAGVVGGGAVAGAVIGAITGGRKGAVKGAVVGAGAGGAVVLLTRGEEVDLAPGAELDVALGSDLLLEGRPD